MSCDASSSLFGTFMICELTWIRLVVSWDTRDIPHAIKIPWVGLHVLFKLCLPRSCDIVKRILMNILIVIEWYFITFWELLGKTNDTVLHCYVSILSMKQLCMVCMWPLYSYRYIASSTKACSALAGSYLLPWSCKLFCVVTIIGLYIEYWLSLAEIC